MKSNPQPDQSIEAKCETCGKVHELVIDNLIDGSEVRVLQCPNDAEAVLHVEGTIPMKSNPSIKEQLLEWRWVVSYEGLYQVSNTGWRS